MGRPAKPAGMQADQKHKTRNEKRKEAENKIGSGAVKLTPESWLSKPQKAIFRSVVAILKDSEILRNADTHILSEFAWSLDMKNQTEKYINDNSEMRFDREVLSALDKYTKTFFRCCNELGLSPQSRAKVAANIVKTDDGTAALLKILADGDEEDDD